MTRIVHTLNEAKSLLDYFNGFHDGFIKKLTILSHDEFEERGVQSKSKRLDLGITFAHYNYQQDQKSAQQQIEATFNEVMNLRTDFSGFLHEWSIYEVSIFVTERKLEDGTYEPCLGINLLQSRLVNEREWHRHEDLNFTFSYATFIEL